MLQDTTKLLGDRQNNSVDYLEESIAKPSR